MLPPLNDNTLETGFCWGQYELRIDDTARLRLCKEIVTSLTVQKISRLWRCPDPSGPRFILCPVQQRSRFVQGAQQYLKEASDAEEKTRLLYSGTDAAVDGQGRVRIQKACLDHVGIDPPQQVLVLGVGFWYEVTARISSAPICPGS